MTKFDAKDFSTSPQPLSEMAKLRRLAFRLRQAYAEQHVAEQRRREAHERQTRAVMAIHELLGGERAAEFLAMMREQHLGMDEDEEWERTAEDYAKGRSVLHSMQRPDHKR